MSSSNLEKLQELLGFLSQNLIDARANFRAFKAYRSASPEGQRFASQLLNDAATQLADRARELATLTGKLAGSVDSNGAAVQSQKPTAVVAATATATS